jgi:transcriptional regulator with XRE-family HTH domain
MDGLYDRIKKIADDNGLSINRLEEVVKVSQGTFTKLKNPKKDTTTENLRKIILEFKDVDPGWLLTGEEKRLGSGDTTEVEILKEQKRALERTLLTLTEQLAFYLKKETEADENKNVGT